MPLPILIIGPTLMNIIGIQIMHSAPLTFILFYGWLFTVPIITLIKMKQGSLNPVKAWLGLKADKESLLYGLLTGAFGFIIIFAGVSWLQKYFFDIMPLKTLLQKWDFSGQFTLGLGLILIIVNPFLEEIYWRGLVFMKLREKCAFVYANIITAVFYSLYHTLTIFPMFKPPFNIIGVIPVFIAGLIWGYLKNKYNSLSGPILSHTLSDIGILMIYFKFLH